jgi:hypothetical protein
VTPENRQAKSRIQASVRLWKHLIPPGWTVRHLFIEGKVDTESADVVAETDAAWQYHQATIRWSLPAVAGLDQKYLDATVVHELVHVLLSPMESQLRTDEGDHAGIVNGLCEFTVEAVSLAILRVAH